MSTISGSLLISFAEKYTALLVSFGSAVGPETVMASVGKEESNHFIVLLAGALTAFVGWIFGIFVVKRSTRQHSQEVLGMARGYLKRT